MESSERIGAIGLVVLALVGAIAAVTLFINLPWFDEELQPALARLTSPQPVSMEGNAYPMVWGLTAASDRDPHATGVRIIETIRERYPADRPVALSREEIDDILGNPPDEDWMQQTLPSSSCDWRREQDWRREHDCAERLIAELAQGVTSERLALLLDRFDTMLTFERFEESEALDPATPAPSYGPVMALSRIRLALAFDEQRSDVLLDQIGTDIRFWKMMLRDGDILLSKMIALTGLRDSMQFVSALMRERDLSPAELARIPEVLTPLSDEERDIGETFLAEAGYVMRNVLPVAPRNLIFQRNATMNDFYAMATAPMLRRAALSASEYYAQLDEKRARYSVPLFPPPLYNLGGKLFILSKMPNLDLMTDFISRVHDIDGRIALVLLQAEILANPDVPIERVVQRSQHRNPYTLEPMDYDAASGMLSFECLGSGVRLEVCAVEVGRD